MKYKLINKQTNEEHLCDKVTIDGCSYYVSNEKATEGFYGYINFQGGDIKKIGKYFADDWKKVIACNNPNIDIPKVVDDIEGLAIEYLNDNYGYVWDKGDIDNFKYAYSKSQETHPFSEEDMIEFYEWCNFPIYREHGNLGFNKRVMPQFPDYNVYTIIDETGKSILPQGKFLTTKELFQFWKEQQPKIVYYGTN